MNPAESLQNVEINQNDKFFTALFGNSTGSVINASPASLILLGDHTHYNDGILISACIDKYWIFQIKKRKDGQINLASPELNDVIRLKLEKLEPEEEGTFKLLRGLLLILKEEGFLRTGFDCAFSSNVPECLGLGSMAAQQVGFLNALRKALLLKFDDEKLLSMVSRNESLMLGKISNIAHHYTVLYGKENKLFFMDLRTKAYTKFSVDCNECSLAICDSGERIVEPHRICAERIEECEIGTKGLRLYLWGIKNLRDIELEFLHKHFHMLPGRIFQRVLYNVKERIRTQEGIKLIRKKIFEDFGRLVLDSHMNLSNDYEIGNEHSSFLVEEAQKIEGVHGSKLISCSPFRSTFNILRSDALEMFKTKMNSEFKKRFGRDLNIYSVRLTGGIKNFSQKTKVGDNS